MEPLTRRGLLVAGSLAGSLAVTGCSAHQAASPIPSGPVTSGPVTSGPASSGPASWRELAATLDGRLLRPGSKDYATARLTPNPRYDAATPLALLEAGSADDVAAGLGYARNNSVPVALRSGGHCYAGWSAGDQRLVIDTRALSEVTWHGNQIEVGAGIRIGDLYPQLAARGRAIPTGSCPTVGVTGLTLGGGVGVLTRAYGLTCDHLVSLVVVLPHGEQVTASATENPDLFWALRGGGGGHGGVVTALRFSTVAAPTVSASYLTWPAARAPEVIEAWFDWIGAADPAMWSTIKLLGGSTHPNGPSLGATITWVGPESGFEAAVAPILATKPAARTDHVRSYAETMAAYAGSGAREAFAATSRVAYSALSSSAVSDLVDLVNRTPQTLTEAGVSFDALGGRVGAVASDATAFVHRDALAIAQCTATYDPSTTRASVATDWSTRLRRALAELGDHAYINYVDPTIDETAYFGANTERLRSLWASYDPDGILTQPQ